MMRYKLKRYILLAAFFLALTFILAPFRAFADSPVSMQTYIVGSNRQFGSFMTAGDFFGPAYDYFSLISKFTDDDYKYVQGTPEELFSLLLNGSIDIIPCVTKEEFEIYGSIASGGNAKDSFILTSKELLPKFNAIYVSSDRNDGDPGFGDLDELSKLKIAYLSEERSSYFDTNTFFINGLENARFRAFYDEEYMYDAFRLGTIDAVIKSSFRAWDNEKIVWRGDSEPSYFVVRAQNKELAQKLDNAVMEINKHYSDFPSELYKKYVLRGGFQVDAYSDTAAEYISSHDKITIGFNLRSETMNHYNSESASLKGLTGYIMNMLFQNIGIDYSLIVYTDRASCIQALQDGYVDLIYGGISPYDYPRGEDFSSTYPMLQQPIVFLGHLGTENISSTSKIAVSSENEEIMRCIESYYPFAQITMFASDSDAVKAVKSGHFDYFCTGSYNALEIQSSDSSELHIVKVFNSYVNEAFGYRSDNEALREIIDCGIAELGGNSVLSSKNYIYFSNMINGKINRSDRINFVLIVFIAILIPTSVLVIITIKLHSRSEEDIITGGRTKQKFFTDSQKLLNKADPSKWAMIVFDIDKFKFINEHLGYDEGDHMLKRVYDAIAANVHSDEVFARTSNDNFALILYNTKNKDVEKRMTKIFNDFAELNSKYVTYPVFFSAGICRLDQCVGKYNVVNLNLAIDRCNIAKKSIKNINANKAVFYDGEIRKKAQLEKDYENAMPQALADGEFMCYLQPKYGSKSRHIEGAEALIRWESKEYGFVFPDQFIPIAEKNGFVVELDFFILEEVCKAMRRWIDSGLTPVIISVNQSRRHLNQDDYIFRLREIVDRYEIPYELIELELTESVFTDNADLMLRIMQKLHEIGFKLSIDDFGSGYSSLNMLKDIPADVLKIDREFFSGTVNSLKGRKVISTVVDLTKNLDMEVIAEGVETLDQVEFLEDIECQLIQGYFFSKPISIPDFESLWAIDHTLANNERIN